MIGITPMTSVILIACSTCTNTLWSQFRPSYYASDRASGLTWAASLVPVNAIIGDASFVTRFGRQPNRFDDDDLRIATHLAYVERLLRSRDVSGLSPTLLRERARNLDRLHAYRLAGTFPRNHGRPGRWPCFIDRDGRICAVGYLVACSAGLDAARAIDAQYHNAHVNDMTSPIVTRWIAGSGLTREEAATIQGDYAWEDYNRAFMRALRLTCPECREVGTEIHRIVTRRQSVVADSSETQVIDTFQFEPGMHTGKLMTSSWRSGGRKRTITMETNFEGEEGPPFSVWITERDSDGKIRVATVPYRGGANPLYEAPAMVIWASGGATYEQARQCADGRQAQWKTIRFDAASGFASSATRSWVRFLPPEDEERARNGSVTVEHRGDGARVLTMDYTDSLRGYVRTMRLCDSEIVEDRGRDLSGRQIWHIVRDSAHGGYIGTRCEYDTALTGHGLIPSTEASYHYVTYADAFNGTGDYIRLVRRVADFDEQGNWVYMDEHLRYYDATGAATVAENIVTREIEYHEPDRW